MGRSIHSLDIVYVRDRATGQYTAYYNDMPFLVVQAGSEKEAEERLKDLMIIYLRSLPRIIKQ